MRKLSWLTISVLLFTIACTKIETTTIGNGLIPPVDGVNTLETTLDVITNSFIDPQSDTVRVRKQDDHVVGNIVDPLFGTTTAEAYFELKPTFYKYYLPRDTFVAADSAVLTFRSRGVYGDTTISQTWEVYELDDTLKADTIYPVSKRFATKASLGSKTIELSKLSNTSNEIRIKLSGAFAKRLIEDYDSTTNGAYVNDSTFRSKFHGFAVKSTGGGNALVRINLLDTGTKLALYYNYPRLDSPTKKIYGVSNFRFSPGIQNTVSGSANYIKRNYDGFQFANYFDSTTRNDTLAFVQTYPGTFTTIKIPGLRDLPNMIIHRAELIALQVPEGSLLHEKLTVPDFLLLSGYDSTKRVKTNVPNDFVIGASGDMNIFNFGGYPLKRDVPGVGVVNAYIFDLSRYVQGIVTRKDSSFTLRLSAPTNDTIKYKEPYPSTFSALTYRIDPLVANNAAIGRVRLGGGGMHPSNQLRMRLRIIYSKL